MKSIEFQIERKKDAIYIIVYCTRVVILEEMGHGVG
jgi:hypothetical protein